MRYVFTLKMDSVSMAFTFSQNGKEFSRLKVVYHLGEVVYLTTFYATLSQKDKVAYYLKTNQKFAHLSSTNNKLTC